MTDGVREGRRGAGAPRRTPACIVWEVWPGERARAQILFLRGEEDADHMVAFVDLPPVASREEAWIAGRAIAASLTAQMVARLKSRAVPLGRTIGEEPGALH